MMEPVEVDKDVGFEPIEIVSLGRTAVPVTQMAIGTVSVGGLFDSVLYDDSYSTLEEAWDREGRFFDVAPLYGYGSAE